MLKYLEQRLMGLIFNVFRPGRLEGVSGCDVDDPNCI